MTIGELAKKSGNAPSAIRYYESMGLISGIRTEGGQRRYGNDALEALRYITFAKAAGFTLSEISTLNPPAQEGDPLFARWKELSERKLEELDEVIRRAEKMKKLLRHALDCRCTKVDDCGLLAEPKSKASIR
jgi:MerR family transcriptional regulator, redox-sensitive transcriptional activator SoxR